MASASVLEGRSRDMAGNRIGQRVGPFELAERLESDGTLSLYRAIRPAGSREPRVVSIRLSEDPRDERAAAWVRNEYDTLRALSEPGHPSIARPYGYYASQAAVAMEDLPRVSLADALRLRADGRVPLDAATAVDILVELAQCLRHAHSSTGPQGPILHGHISPEHVRLLPTGSLRLVGFGRPSSGRVPSYTAPEQAAGAFMDARTDHWSLGALGVEMLLGQALYAGTPDPTGLALQGRVGPWLDRLERRWPEVCRVLARCLAPAAGDRYNREADLVRDLLAAARTIGGRADIAALAGRIQALLPAPEKPWHTGGNPDPEGARSVPPGEDASDETTLVPSEDDVDPSSVRGAAMRSFDAEESGNDQATSHDPVWQTQEAWEQANTLPPSLAASSHPAAKRARAARLEEQRRPPTALETPPAEDEPAPTPAAAEDHTDTAQAPSEGPQLPETPETSPAAEDEDGPTAGEPPPAPPSSSPGPEQPPEVAPAPAAEADEDEDDAEELELDQTEEAPRTAPGSSDAQIETTTAAETSADAPTDAARQAPVSTVVPEFAVDEDPSEDPLGPAWVEGLRWTELLAVIAMAALLVTGATFLLGLFG